MDIIVLVKEIPDLSVWVEVEPKTHRVDQDDLIYIVNPCDLVALCLAIRLIRSLESGSVTAILLGPKRAEKTLKKCLEYGANRAIHLVDEDVVDLESHQIALILAEAVIQMGPGYDLIFSGHDHSRGGFATGQIGSQVGSLLDLPQVSQVIRIKPGQDPNDLFVECHLDLGDLVRLKCRPPMLFTIHPDAEQINYPSLAAFLSAPDMEPEQVSLKDLNLDPSRIERRTDLESISSPRPRPKKVFTPDSALSAAERMRLVMGGGLKKKQSEFMEGSPEELSRYIIDFLAQRRIRKLGQGKNNG